MDRDYKGNQVSVRVHTMPFVTKTGGKQLQGTIKRNLMEFDELIGLASNHHTGFSNAQLAGTWETFIDEIQTQLQQGNGVVLRGIGRLYIKCTGVQANDKPTPADIDGFTVGFMVDRNLDKFVSKLTVDEVTLDAHVDPVIKDFYNENKVNNKTANKYELEDKCTVVLRGSNLKMEGTDSGIWLAPWNGTAIDPDTSMWLPVNLNTLSNNTGGVLRFQVPDISTASGKSYKAVVKTRSTTRAAESIMLQAESVNVCTVK